jgi:hypothetical protein
MHSKISLFIDCNFGLSAILIALAILFPDQSLADHIVRETSSRNAWATPSDDFLYFTELEPLSGARYYLANPQICDHSEDHDAKKRFMCSVLSSESSVRPYQSAGLYLKPSTQVAFIGEGHIDYDTQIEFSKLLRGFYEQGFTTLAMEMFPASTQPALDLFYQGQMTLDQIMNVLSEHWFYKKEGYIEILRQAQALNFKIIGIDDRESFKQNDLWTEIALRDNFMAQNLADYVDQTREKVVVYSGKMHAVKSFGEGYEPGLSQKLIRLLQNKNINIETENILFATFRRSYVFREILNADGRYENQSLMAVNPNYKQFADAVIYLKPTENLAPTGLELSSLNF